MSDEPQKPVSAFKAIRSLEQARQKAQERQAAAASSTPVIPAAPVSVGKPMELEPAESGPSPRFKKPRLHVLSPEAQKEVRICALCQGKGYTMSTLGAFARARVCECQNKCPTCHGQGFALMRNELGYLYHLPCACREIFARVEIFNQARIPARYAHDGLNTFEELGARVPGPTPLSSLEGFARFYPENRRGYLLVGNTGVGKTHLMVGVIKILTLEKGIPCLFMDFLALLSDMMHAWDAGDSVADIIRPLIEVEVLVVDELGKGRNDAGWETALLDEIICKRYNERKTTLFTTNFPLSLPDKGEAARSESARAGGQASGASGHLHSTSRRGQNLSDGRFRETLEQRVGERIFSRLKQMCEILRVDGEDYRASRGVGKN